MDSNLGPRSHRLVACQKDSILSTITIIGNLICAKFQSLSNTLNALIFLLCSRMMRQSIILRLNFVGLLFIIEVPTKVKQSMSNIRQYVPVGSWLSSNLLQCHISQTLMEQFFGMTCVNYYIFSLFYGVWRSMSLALLGPVHQMLVLSILNATELELFCKHST